MVVSIRKILSLTIYIVINISRHHTTIIFIQILHFTKFSLYDSDSLDNYNLSLPILLAMINCNYLLISGKIYLIYIEDLFPEISSS